MILPCRYEGAEVPNDYEGKERRLGQYNQTLITMFLLVMDTLRALVRVDDKNDARCTVVKNWIDCALKDQY